MTAADRVGEIRARREEWTLHDKLHRDPADHIERCLSCVVEYLLDRLAAAERRADTAEAAVARAFEIADDPTLTDSEAIDHLLAHLRAALAVPAQPSEAEQ